ncbi:MAG: hypothetical protein SOX32_08075 [Candidatus Choladocola sp.]|nr:hypothetical protein [Candidatus Choladocola sp.]
MRAGNFKEQYLNSALAQILEAEASSVPDLNLHFYPDDALLEAVSGPFESFREELEQKGSELEEKMQVEKTEDGETTVYTARMATEDLTDFYRLIFEAYLSGFTESGLMEGSVTEEELENQIDQIMDVIPMVMGDEVLVNFTVQDDLLQKIDYEVRSDTTVLEQQETIPEAQPSVAETAAAVEEEETVVTELVEETLAPAGDVADAAGAQRPDEEHLRNQTQHTEAEENGQEMVVEAGPFIGTCSCEIVFTDPENRMQDFAYRMTITSEDGSEFASMEVKKETKASFDSSTGDFDAFLTMRADDGVEVILGLESTFRDVEKGKSFCWCLDELYVEAGVQRVAASAEITVSADPGTFDAPEKERFLLDLTQGGLLDLVNEITGNAEAWSAQFEPETEAETDADTAVRTAVIGGADGPTSIFVAGKTAN